VCTICSVPDGEPSAIELLRGRFGGRPFRTREALQVGVSRTTVHRLREEGALEAAGRGVVRLAGTGMGMLSDLAVVSARVPGGTICLNSALAFWDLTDEIPARVHVAIARGARPPLIDHPATVVHTFDAGTSELERCMAQTDVDEPFWIYSAERTVIDAMRLPRLVGQDVALQALRRYLAQRGSSPARLTELARELGGERRLRSALEALLS
jgi:predicted transcriptional regulator of viral defense system